jgi:hypothetical protein
MCDAHEKQPPFALFLFSSLTVSPLHRAVFRTLSVFFETTQPAHELNAPKRAILVEGEFLANFTVVEGISVERWPSQAALRQEEYGGHKVHTIIKNALPAGMIPTVTTVSTYSTIRRCLALLVAYSHSLLRLRWGGATV